MESQERKLLRACCRALMAADNPADLTQDERDALEQFANEQAADQGFDNWIDAYHRA